MSEEQPLFYRENRFGPLITISPEMMGLLCPKEYRPIWKIAGHTAPTWEVEIRWPNPKAGTRFKLAYLYFSDGARWDPIYGLRYGIGLEVD